MQKFINLFGKQAIVFSLVAFSLPAKAKGFFSFGVNQPQQTVGVSVSTVLLDQKLEIAGSIGTFFLGDWGLASSARYFPKPRWQWSPGLGFATNWFYTSANDGSSNLNLGWDFYPSAQALVNYTLKNYRISAGVDIALNGFRKSSTPLSFGDKVSIFVEAGIPF